MKAWTITAAALAATLTLTAACTEDGPGSVAAVPETEAVSASTVNVYGVPVSRADAEFLLLTVPARNAALRAALEEIRLTFTADDYQNRRWETRWPEIWGANGWDVGNRLAPPHELRPAEVQLALAAWRELRAASGMPIDEIHERRLADELIEASRTELEQFLDDVRDREGRR